MGGGWRAALWMVLVVSLLALTASAAISAVSRAQDQAASPVSGATAAPPERSYPTSVRLVSLGGTSPRVLPFDDWVGLVLFLVVAFSGVLMVRLAWPHTPHVR